MATKLRPKVGISVLVFKKGQILLGTRKNAHGAGEYASPGGHLEFGESIVEAAKRECWEEAGIEIENVRFIRLSNMKKYDKHYVDIGLAADWKSGESKVMEPERIVEWDWYDADNLPRPLFGMIEQTLKALKTGQNFFDE